VEVAVVVVEGDPNNEFSSSLSAYVSDC